MHSVSITKGEPIDLLASFMIDGVGATLSEWTITGAVFDVHNQKQLNLTIAPTQATRYFSITGSSSTLKPMDYVIKVRLTNGTLIRTIEFKLQVNKDVTWT
jgi:hypothetical protein